MCIRDRFQAEGQKLSGTALATEMRFQLAAPPQEAGDRASTCLLYTSDAADERSSVDLGGRRIIKKKKLSQRPEYAETDSIYGIPVDK